MISDAADFCYNKKTLKYIDTDRLGGYLDGKMVRHDEKGGF